MFHVNNEDKVIAFARWDDSPENATVVLVNFAHQAHDNYTIGLPAGGEWKVRFNSNWDGYDADFNNFPSYGTQALPGDVRRLPPARQLRAGPLRGRDALKMS
ncbi:MAG: alpha amylase C-terminal domain-containing protein [Hymenobacter sp.]